jgi:hypothetical protein
MHLISLFEIKNMFNLFRENDFLNLIYYLEIKFHIWMSMYKLSDVYKTKVVYL